MVRHVRVRTLGMGVLLAALGTGVGAQQPVRPAAAPGDGLLRSELSLMGRTASVAVMPGLKTGGIEHQSLTGSGASASGRVRVGQLQTNGTLQFGSVALGKPDPAGVRYDLWLVGATQKWELVVEPSATASGAAQPASGQTAASPAVIPLAWRSNSGPTPVLVAAWVPRMRDTARLVFTWGTISAETDVQFIEPRMPRQTGVRQTEPVSRKHDEPNRGARLLMLSQLNETALVLPGGARVSATFGRTFPRGQRSVSAAGTLGRVGPDVEGADFSRLMATADGSVVELWEAPVPRVLAGAPLRFGKVVLRTANQAPGYPGAYGVWLKRVGQGWRLVFNSEPDVWGTQHDPRFDVADIEARYAHTSDATRPFGVVMVPTAADRGRLVLHWGPHEWSADFVAGP